MRSRSVSLSLSQRSWQLREPFVISRGTSVAVDVIIVELEWAGFRGRGEAVGVDYHGETPDSMRAQIESVRAAIEMGATRAELLALLPAGGARNALDAALWDLEAKRSGTPVWQLVGTDHRPVVSAITIGIRSPAEFEARARELARYSWLKIKVSASRPLEAVAAVRRAAPGARLIVDANQAWDVQTLYALSPALAELRVDLIEQPVPFDADEDLVADRCPVPVCADESIDTIADLPRLLGRYQFINIKLDKTGGLTAALELARAARAKGLRLMVGCMVGSSLAMAPGMVLAQLCDVADLDGPLLQTEDWPNGIHYTDGLMAWPSPELWG
jgi:L-alanine-DL-glutamate epimerase-like enolase superfamily enzyme